MKKTFPIRSIPVCIRRAAAVLVQLFAVLLLGIVLSERIDSLEQALNAAPAEKAEIPVIAEAEKYVLRSWCGRIGIFTAGSDTPDEVLGVYIFTLPEADRKALEIGITAYSQDGLRALIEDFTA